MTEESQLTPQLPMNERFTDLDQLVGHTIKAVFEEPFGRYKVDLVIVTETGCWLAAAVESWSPDERASLCVHRNCLATDKQTLHDFVLPGDLFDAGLIDAGVRDQLIAAEVAREASRNAARAARLRAELERLEPTPPANV